MTQSNSAHIHASTALPALGRLRHNLPAPLSAFVGRGDEYVQLLNRLRDPSCRLVTISGAGGAGKTRLALEAARALVPAPENASPFLDGVYLVPLASLSAREPLDEAMATTIAATLGISLSGPEAAVFQVRQYLRARSLLLLLDNLEHLPGAAAFVADLLHDTSALTILTTSRDRLNIRGEWVITLDGLTFPDADSATPALPADQYSAVQLFAELAHPLAPDFALTAETIPAVLEICRLVGGLPLGIELAASWLPVLSCAEIAQEIVRSIDFLASAFQDVPERQQSLRAVFASSWNLLAPTEQRVLRRLAVFQGSFSRDAVLALLADPDPAESSRTKLSTLNALAALVNKSLLRRTGGSTGSAARFDMLEPLRQYATEELTQAGEVAATAARHAAYYLDMLAARTADLRGPGQQAALDTIGLEIAQIRAAWRWAVSHTDERAIERAVAALFHFYDMRSWFGEGVEAFTAAALALAPAAGGSPSVVYGSVLARQGWFTFQLGRQREGQALLERSLALLRTLNAGVETVFALNYLGATCSYVGENKRTMTLCREGLALAQSLGDLYGQAIACNILGQTAYDQGDYVAAQSWCQQSLAIEQQIGNRWSMAFSQTTLGKVAYATGKYIQARSFFEQSLQTRKAMGDSRGVAICFNWLGDTAVALGQSAEARERYTQALALFRDSGNRWGMAAALINLGQFARTRHHAAALRLFQEALRLALDTGATPQVAAILVACANLVRRSGAAAWADDLEHLAAEHAELAPTHPHLARLLAWVWPETDSSAGPMTLERAIAEADRQVDADVQQQAIGTPPPLRASTQVAQEKPSAKTMYPAGLTAREVDVLRLVAQGLTDAQVAERLIVSPRTVSTHLTSIYSKLQVNSRSAATRFAFEHGLV